MRDFEYLRPVLLRDALAALAPEGARALAGGQTLLPAMKLGLAAPEKLVEIGHLAELKGITRDNESLTIGAAVRHGEVADTPIIWTLLPALADLAGSIGDPQVRNKGTIGGSLANNDPAACWPAAVLALDAVITTSARRLPAAEFFTGLFETALAPGELVVSVRFALPRRAAYAKFKHPASRFAMAGVFAAEMRDGSARVAVTGAGNGGVFRWREAERALEAGGFSAAALKGLVPDEALMMSDAQAAPDYRAALVAAMARRAVEVLK